ncbi:hypothetical protein L1887_62431 [Cichorium endivia]|nr:hypothetical protein L1887_62431 [Cichorium endivia]
MRDSAPCMLLLLPGCFDSMDEVEPSVDSHFAGSTEPPRLAKIPKSVGFASRLPLLLSIYATRAGWQMGNLIDRHSFTRLATGVAGAPASNAAACLAESWDCCGSPRASGATMICNRTSKAAQPRRALAASTRSAPPKIGWAGSAREWLGSG